MEDKQQTQRWDVLTDEQIVALRRQHPKVDHNNVLIAEYYHYLFVLLVKLAPGVHLKICVGGDAYNVYRFDPRGGWPEWDKATIVWCKQLV